MVMETERLVESRRLLEAHARLMDLERWQDDILWQLYGAAGPAGSALSPEEQELVGRYFSGVGQLVEALGTRAYKQHTERLRSHFSLINSMYHKQTYTCMASIFVVV